MDKTLLPSNWSWWNKTIQINEKINNRIRWRLHYLLHYEYIKNQSKIIAIDLSRQKEIDADSKSIQQIKLVRQLKNMVYINAHGTQSMFTLTILEKNRKFLKKCNSLINNGKLSWSES